MYICCDCYKIIEDEELRFYYEPHGEKFACCPYCGSNDLEHAAMCECCEGAYSEEDLIDGICENCLIERITLKDFEIFALEDCKDHEVSIFEEFIFTELYGIESDLMHQESSKKLKDDLKKIYENYEDKEFLYGCIKNFILRYYAQEYAEYINVKRIKKEN